MPKAGATPPGRGPRIGSDPEDTNRLTPVWSVAIFDHAGPWGRNTCDRDGALWEELFPKLKAYESMTWGEIYKDKKRNHSVSVGGIIKAARDRLRELKLDDTDELFRFRLSGAGRVWGIRDGRVFLLLWWDPDHAVWPTGPN
jgi:hypothetical protein